MKRLSYFLLILLLACSLASGALSINTAYDVRPTVGAGTNGGGYVLGSTGTNYAINNNKNAAGCTSCGSSSVNLSVTDGVTAGTTTITSATANFSAAIVGNVIYVAGGTGSVTASRYEVKTFTNSTTIVVDRSTGLTAGTGVTLNIGGALDAIATVTQNLAGNRIFVKNSGTLTIGATAFTLNNDQTPSSTTPMNVLSGYSSVWGDCHAPAAANCTGGRPTIQATAGTGYYMITGTPAAGWIVENFILDCNSRGSVGGISTNWYTTVANNKIMNCPGSSIANVGEQDTNIDNEITADSSGGCMTFSGTNNSAIRNYIHDSTCTSAIAGSAQGFVALFNIIDTITGGINNGITASGRNITIMNNTIYNVGAACLSLQNLGVGGNIRNNILSTCGTYGLESTSAWAAMPNFDGNAFYAPGTANRHFVDDTGSVNPIDAAGPYTNVLDITCGTDPLTNAAGADFSLSSTACGTALKGTGSPGRVQGLSNAGYMSFGAYQPQYGQGGPGGGGASAYVQ